MRNRRKVTRALAAVVTLSLVLGACSTDDDDTGSANATERRATGSFVVKLSAGEAAASPGPAIPVVRGQGLPRDDTAAIIGRLPAFDAGEGDDVAFNRPPEPLPRPRAGRTVEAPLGAGDDRPPPAAPSGPLKVVRYQPDGDVDVAPVLSVTFNQPMVPVGTRDQLDAEDVPVRVTPAPDGRWRWIGTRTLRFEHGDPSVDRLPAATEYTVEVPAGTESATGGVLDEAVVWTFATPPPQVRSIAPAGEVITTDPVFVVTFDQRVDPEAVLDHVTLTADGDRRAVRLATPEQVEADDEARQRTEQALDGRWVAFRAEDPLPTAAEVTIEVGAGTPSAEGPRVSEEAATHRARTYDALAVARKDCGYGSGCRAGQPFTIELNNPLDLATFDPEAIEIEPAATTTVQAYGNTIVVQAQTAARTTYEVTLPASLGDTFGQTLGGGETVSFEVGDAAPALHPFPRSVLTADPFGETPAVTVTSIGHETLDVVLYAVDTDDFGAYQRFRARWDGESLDRLPPWDEVSSTTVEVGSPDTLTETTIDLGEAIPDGVGHVVVTVAPTRTFPRTSEDYWQNLPLVAWVQATSIGVDALADDDGLVAWATDLRDGSPVPDVEIDLGGRRATTGGDGLASVAGVDDSRFLVARKGDDSAVLTADNSGSWESAPIGDVARWFVLDDRQLYRPGEQVRVKGWVRRLELAGDATIGPVGGRPSIRYVARDALGNEIAAGQATTTGAGGFELTVDVPPGAALGPAAMELTLEGAGPIGEATTVHQFEVQEFRRPEFEVVSRAESPGPHVLTGPVTLAATASYFAGGTLADAPVRWEVATRTTAYSPPNWSDFTFGVWKPFWTEGGGGRGGELMVAPGNVLDPGPVPPCCPPPEEESRTYEARTDATGTNYLRLDFEGETPDEPITVSANASVEDVNRQSFGSTVDLLVHPASLYVGLRSDRTFVRQGDPLDVDVIVTDIDGAAVAGREVTVTATRLVERFEDGAWTEVGVDPQECEVTSGEEPVPCGFDTGTGGRYRISSTVTDDDGGRSRSDLTRWVSGADAVPTRNVEEQVVTIVPAAKEHQPGDTAELLVISPFGPASGLATITRNGIEETRTFEVPDGSTVLELPITDAHIPGIDVRVDLVGAAPRTRDDGTEGPDLPRRPAFASGSVRLPVTATSKTLAVDATPADPELQPGGTTSVEITVEDPAGRPVAGAEVAVVVVDEAVLSLVGAPRPDPVAAIHRPLEQWLRTDRSRQTLVLQRPGAFGGDASTTTVVAVPSAAPAAGGAGGPAAFRSSEGEALEGADPAAPGGATQSTTAVDPAAISVRSDFDALALFEPAVPTGPDGTATVEVTVPGNLTRYRVLAVAADDGDRFGVGESTITARLPLMVRPSPPRFVNFGDRFELPVVVQNQSDEALDVDVVLETNLSGPGPAARRITVPADERVEVRFPVAVEHVGTARYRVTAVSGALSDSATGELPAYTPTTTEAFATYGVLDGDGAVVQPLLAPTGVVPQFGGLEIDTSSTALQALTDAVVYLTDYPYGSADAYASRIIALVALRDVFAAFDAAGAPSPQALDDRIRSDLEALVALQGDDGGFSTWQRGRPADPYATVQATHALVVASAAGYPVAAGARDRALERLATIEERFPPDWARPARNTVLAYALSVRNLAGARDAARAEALYRSDDALSLDALAWLWPVVDDPAVHAAIAATFDDRVTETPAAATFTTGLDESARGLVLASDRRTDGLVLDALLAERPDSDLVPKVVAGLVGNQVRGRWSNVQENGFILLALKRYFDRFEAADPAFVARVWLGGTYTAEHPHRGRSIDTTRTVVPMSELAGNGDIVVGKEGPGRLYYRLGLRYAPSDLRVDPRDEGFVVDRTYEAVDDPDDVQRGADGTWRIAPGAMVRARLTMVADSRRTNMALVDSLPAGLEPLNPALAATPRAPADDREPSPPLSGTWFDHQELRDDRASAFAAYLPAGTYEYSYVARATTPGTFVAPPARAEEIYAPEVFGRSATDTVVIASG